MSIRTRGPHTCWWLSTETWCFECLEPIAAVDGVELLGAADPLADLAPSFDQDAYYDGEPGA